MFIGNGCNVAIGCRISPNKTKANNERTKDKTVSHLIPAGKEKKKQTVKQAHLLIAGVRWCTLVAKRLDNLCQSTVFPADQDVTRSLVLFDHLLNTLGIISVARRIDRDAEILAKGLYGAEGARSLSIYFIGGFFYSAYRQYLAFKEIHP